MGRRTTSSVVGVVEETADAHSVSFAVPEGAEAEFDYKPGQFLTLAVPSDQTGGRGALLLAVVVARTTAAR